MSNRLIGNFPPGHPSENGVFAVTNSNEAKNNLEDREEEGLLRVISVLRKLTYLELLQMLNKGCLDEKQKMVVEREMKLRKLEEKTICNSNYKK